MRPNSSATIRDDLAETVAEHSAQLLDQFMGMQIFPVLPVRAQSASFGKLPIENVTNQASDGKRAPSAGYDRGQSELETDTYTCEEFGFEEPIDDGVANMLASYLDAEQYATTLATFRLMRAWEKRIDAIAFSATVFASYTGDVGTEWSAAGGTPYSDVQDTILTIKQNCGGALNGEICLAVSEKVYRNLVQTTEFKNMRKGGTGSTLDVNGMPMADEVARILGINKVFYSAAQDNGSDIWDDEYALLFVRGTSNNLAETVQLGRSFLWVSDSPEAATAETYRDEPVRSNIVRVRQHVDEKLLCVNAGYLLSNITA